MKQKSIQDRPCFPKVLIKIFSYFFPLWHAPKILVKPYASISKAKEFFFIMFIKYLKMYSQNMNFLSNFKTHFLSICCKVNFDCLQFLIARRICHQVASKTAIEWQKICNRHEIDRKYAIYTQKKSKITVFLRLKLKFFMMKAILQVDCIFSAIGIRNSGVNGNLVTQVLCVTPGKKSSSYAAEKMRTRK